MSHEAYISAFEKEKKKQTRIPGAYGFRQWQKSSCTAQSKRQEKTLRF